MVRKSSLFASLSFLGLFVASTIAQQPVGTRPAVGSSSSPSLAVTPHTGASFLALPNGDLIESLVFLHDYRKKFPSERASLLLPKITRVPETIVPAVAYTRAGKVYVHSYRIGEIAAPAEFTPVNFDQPAYLSKLYDGFAGRCRGFYSSRLQRDLKDSSQFAAALREAPVVTVQPDRLANDTEQKQLDRAFNRLREIGVSASMVKESTGKGPHLIIEWRGLQFYWSPKAMSGYNGLGAKPAIDPVLEGILFAMDFNVSQRGEKALCYPHSYAKSPGRLGATTLFTRGGKVYVHDQQAGDLECAAIKPENLSNREEVIRVANEVRRAAIASLKKDRLVLPPATLAPEPDRSVAAMAAELQRRGVATRIVGTPQSLQFEWLGARYNYMEGFGCSIITNSNSAKTGKKLTASN